MLRLQFNNNTGEYIEISDVLQKYAVATNCMGYFKIPHVRVDNALTKLNRMHYTQVTQIELREELRTKYCKCVDNLKLLESFKGKVTTKSQARRLWEIDNDLPYIGLWYESAFTGVRVLGIDNHNDIVIYAYDNQGEVSKPRKSSLYHGYNRTTFRVIAPSGRELTCRLDEVLRNNFTLSEHVEKKRLMFTSAFENVEGWKNEA